MKLLPIPAFADNYIWLLHNGADAIVVDPGCTAGVFDALRTHALELRGIVLTHHHHDHSAGVAELHAAYPSAPIWAPALELNHKLSALTALGALPVQAGQSVPLLGCPFDVLDTSGHTAGHIAWYCPAVPVLGAVLLCGDALFDGGCGRIFEGTPEQMYASLQRIAALPSHTRIYCAHEYTLANLRFALQVEPHNAALIAHERRARALRAAAQPTLPTTLAQQLAINPFLRCHEAAVIKAAQGFWPHIDIQNPVEVFAALRQWKNQS